MDYLTDGTFEVEPIPYIDDEIKKTVAFLYADVFRERGEGYDKKPYGTCFFVQEFSPDQKSRTFTMVTAKHVIRDMGKADGQWYVRFNNLLSPRGPGGISYVPIPKDGWIDHPDSAVDLTTLPWMPPPNSNHPITFVALEKTTLSVLPGQLDERRRERGVTEPSPWPPPEGVQVWLLGLLIQHEGTERNYPVMRWGHVALLTEELIHGTDYGPSQYYVIELQVFEGNSGAPVFAQYDEFAIFLGVLSAAFPAKQTTLTTKTHTKPPTTQTYYNLGISLVTPYTKVLEVMDLAKAKKAREPKAIPIGGKAVQLSASGLGEPFTREDFEKSLRKVARKRSKPASRPEKASSGT